MWLALAGVRAVDQAVAGEVLEHAANGGRRQSEGDGDLGCRGAFVLSRHTLLGLAALGRHAVQCDQFDDIEGVFAFDAERVEADEQAFEREAIRAAPSAP